MATTPFQLPTAVIANGTGVNGWLDPTNILLVDDQFAVASGITNVLSVGIFNLNIPQDSTITNFTIRLKGYRGSFNTTLQIYGVDNSTGVDIAYPLAPFQGFSGTNTTYTLGSSLFGTTWTPDQANNIQLKLIADGELHMDAIELEADYVPNVTPVPVPPSSGLVVVDEFVEAIRFNLAQSMTDTDLFCFLQSFNLPDGTPIQYADFHNNPTTYEACLVIDQGIPGLEEQVVITAVDQDYQGTGLCRLSFGTLANRGLKFIYPYDSDPALIRNHGGTAEIVISNSARFYSRFLRKNQINALVSAPIIVEDEGAALVDPAHTLNFIGAGVVVTNDGGDSFKKNIVIPGNGVNPPNVVNVTSTTSGTTPVPSITWSHASSGINRLLVVQVEATATSTVTGVTYNGVALTQGVANTNGILRNEQWYLVAPPVGTYNIIVSVAPDSILTCGAESYVSVDQTTPIGVTQTATGTSLAPALALVTGTDNSLIVDSLVTSALPIAYTVGAGQTENWHITANPNLRQGASSVEPAGSFPDNVTMSWAITQNTAWALNAMEIRGVSSPGATDEKVKVSVADTTPGFLNPKINLHSGDGSITVVTTITNPGANEILDFNITTLGGGGGGTTNLQIDSTPDNGTYGLLGGAVNGINTTFTVSLAAYQAGKLIVTLNGLTQNQGVANDFVETSPGTGVFDFIVAPLAGSTIVVEYQTAASIAQTGIQWQDEGVNLGAAGTADTVDFVGAGVTATRIGNTVTVTIPGGGGGSGTSLEVNVNQVGHGLAVGDVIRSNGTDNEFTTSQGDTASNAESVGLVTAVIDVDNFTYISSAIEVSGAFVPVAVAGTTVWLDPTVAGGMTVIEPTAVGQIKRGLGTVLASGAKMYFDIAALAEEITPASTGGDVEKKVGVGAVDDISWFNIQYPFNGQGGSTDPFCMWDMNNLISVNSVSFVELGTTEYITGNNSDFGSMFPDFDAAEYQFNSTKQLIFQEVCYVATTPNENCGIGYDIHGAAASNKIFASQGTNIVSVGFIRDNTGAWFARAADGVGFTETPITVSLDTKHVFRCEYDPGNATPQARYYLDGVLIATVTTNLPTAVASPVGFSVGNDGGCNTLEVVSCPSFAVEI